MAKQSPKRLIALSASAVATIYLAGLVSTRSAADSVSVTSVSAAANPSAAVTPTTTAAASSTPALAVLVGASATPTQAPASATPTTTPTTAPTTVSTPAATSVTRTSSSYADGTYSATGTSRFGNVTVSVITAAGKISNVQITQVTTKFPVSRIASLPAQVTQNQTANVNVVTGATYSSQAFKQAVQQALSQALAANSSAANG